MAGRELGELPNPTTSSSLRCTDYIDPIPVAQAQGSGVHLSALDTGQLHHPCSGLRLPLTWGQTIPLSLPRTNRRGKMETVNFSLGFKILMFEWILLVGQPCLH